MGLSMEIGNWQTVKEMARLKPMTDCCDLAYMVLRNAEERIKNRIDKRSKIISKKLSLKFSKKINKYFSEHEIICDNFLREDINCCPSPKIEGGENFNVYLKTNNKENFFDVFTCFAGMKHKNYCSYIVRSTLLGESDEVEKNYEFMMSVKKKILEYLKDGISLDKVYKAVQSFAEEKNPILAKHLEKEFGFELGPFFKNESVIINCNSKAVACKDMIFAININLIGLKEAGIEYNLYYGDTVIIYKDQPAFVLTFYPLDNIRKWTLK